MGATSCSGFCGGNEKEHTEDPPEEERALLKEHRKAETGEHQLSLPPQQTLQVPAEALPSQNGLPPATVHSSDSQKVDHKEGRCSHDTHNLDNNGAFASTTSVAACTKNNPTSAAKPVIDAPQSRDVQHLVELPGARRSLLVGINYHGTKAELSGCINDIHRVREAIRDMWNFKMDESSQCVLLDDPSFPANSRPTLANLRRGIAWLVDGARTGDTLYFHYSGHGGREPGSDGQMHETLCPVDYETSGMLIDTEMFETLVKPLPSGCRLTCVLDCCHSAGALDLPYFFVGTKENLDRALAGEVAEMAMSKNWMQDIALWKDGNSAELFTDLASMGLGLWDMYRKRQATKDANEAGFAGSEAAHNAGLSVGEVIAFTGCRSDQTSADVHDVRDQFDVQASGAHARTQDHAGGALTACFLESLCKHQSDASGVTELTYLELLERMRKRLHAEGFSQVPQLASSLVVELHQRFSLTTAFLPPDPRKEKGQSSGGWNLADGALLGGGAACAAGFLTALVAEPHGKRMCSSFHDGYGFPHTKMYVDDANSENDLLTGCLLSEENRSAWGAGHNSEPGLGSASSFGSLSSFGHVDKSSDNFTPTSGHLVIATPVSESVNSWGCQDALADDNWGHAPLNLEEESCIEDEFEDADDGSGGGSSEYNEPSTPYDDPYDEDDL